jgi:3-oxoadipate enol-lactonase
VTIVAAAGGAAIAYSVEGEGEPVAFLNGVMMTMQSWVLQKPEFLKRYRCIFHDFRGQLLSPAPEEPFTLQTHVEDLVQLLDHLGIERCHLIGTSYGGEVGLMFAAAHPHRVRSVAAVAAVSWVDPPLAERVRAWSSVARTDRSALYRTTIADNFSEQFRETNGWILEQGEARLAAHPDRYFADLARLVDAFLNLDLRPQLRSITAPALVMCGELDALKPVGASREIAASIPGAEFLLVPDAGHAVVIEKAAEVNTALIGWVEKQRWN